MFFTDKEHAARWKRALETAKAVTADGVVNVDFGASLYILTALPGVYDRVEKYICNGWIDFKPMLDGMGLSTGERIMVALAGNLYNGSYFGKYTPLDIVAYCDEEMVELAARAMMLRKQRLYVNLAIGDGINCYIVVHDNFSDGHDYRVFWNKEEARKNIAEDVAGVKADMGENAADAIEATGEDGSVDLYVPDSDIWYEWRLEPATIE